MEVKRCYHEAVMYLYLGNESQEREKWGESVAYLQAAHDALNNAVKASKVNAATIVYACGHYCF